MAQLEEGDKAPAFKLPNQDGSELSLADYKGKWIVLYFYPKDLTVDALKNLAISQMHFPGSKLKKAVILGMSKDSVASHKKFADKYGFKFDLVSDESLLACKAYGVWKKKSLYGREYMGIERSTFVINPQGKIAKFINNT